MNAGKLIIAAAVTGSFIIIVVVMELRRCHNELFIDGIDLFVCQCVHK